MIASFIPGIGNAMSAVEAAIPFADAALEGDWDRMGRRGAELGIALALGGLGKAGTAFDDIANN
eukprot:5360771-Prymnesium_polylepis.1